MIKINLIREKRAAGKGGKSSASAIPSGEGLQPIHLALIGILALAAGYVAFTTYKLNTEITRRENEKAELQREKQKLQPIIKKKEELERKRKELDRKIGIITDLRQKQSGPVRLLDELSKALPEDVWFVSVGEQDFGLTINGFARNPNRLADFVDNLTHSGYFNSVELPTWSTEKDSVRFHVTCVFALPAPPAAEPVN